MKQTYEELEAEVHHLRELLKQALEKIAQLEEQLKRNSKNSSKPPSTDQKGNTPKTDKKPPRNSREGRSRLSFPPDKIDNHVQCKQENCPHCGSSKIHLNGRPPEILQQAELPEIRAIITEFQLQKYRCNECGKNSTASLPARNPRFCFWSKTYGVIGHSNGSVACS